MPTNRDNKVSAGAVVIDPTGNRILLIHSRVGRRGWGLPKGHKRSGESIRQCVKREVSEETGLDPRHQIVGPRIGETNQDIYYPREGKTVKRTTIFFLVRAKTTELGRRKNDPHHDRAEWFSWAEAKRLRPRYSYVPGLLDKAHAMVKRRGPNQRLSPVSPSA